MKSAIKFVEDVIEIIEWIHVIEEVNTSKVWTSHDLDIITVKQYYQVYMSYFFVC